MGLACCTLGCCCMGATSSCSLYGIGKSMGEVPKDANSPPINCLTFCFHSRWADLMRTGRHIFLIISMWLLPVQLLLVQPIPCPCHIARNFSLWSRQSSHCSFFHLLSRARSTSFEVDVDMLIALCQRLPSHQGA